MADSSAAGKKCGLLSQHRRLVIELLGDKLYEEVTEKYKQEKDIPEFEKE